MNEFCEWLAATPLSGLFKNVTWIVPLAQTVHILAIAVVLSCAVLIARDSFGPPRSSVGQRHHLLAQLSWIWRGLGVLAATGAVLIISEPDRELLNAMFWAKMLLIVVAIAISAGLRSALRGDPDVPSLLRSSGRLVRVCTTVSLAAWIAIAVAGRWIAYYFPGG